MATTYCLIKYKNYTEVLALLDDKNRHKWATNALNYKLPSIDVKERKSELEETKNKYEENLKIYHSTLCEFANHLGIKTTSSKGILNGISKSENLFKLAGLEGYYSYLYRYFCEYTHNSISTLENYIDYSADYTHATIKRLGCPFLFKPALDFIMIVLCESFLESYTYFKVEAKTEYGHLYKIKKDRQERVKKEYEKKNKTPTTFPNSHKSFE